jgi:hypothetical protein
MNQWTSSKFSLSTNDAGKVIFMISNSANPAENMVFELDHEMAAQIGAVLIQKASQVEYEIAEAVERLMRIV